MKTMISLPVKIVRGTIEFTPGKVTPTSQPNAVSPTVEIVLAAAVGAVVVGAAVAVAAPLIHLEPQATGEKLLISDQSAIYKMPAMRTERQDDLTLTFSAADRATNFGLADLPRWSPSGKYLDQDSAVTPKVKPGHDLPSSAKISDVQILDARTAKPLGAAAGRGWLASVGQLDGSNGFRIAACVTENGESQLRFSTHVYNLTKSSDLNGGWNWVIDEVERLPTQQSSFTQSLATMDLCQ